MDLLDIYARSSSWTLEKVVGAADQLQARTPCEKWDVGTLMDHMLETQHYFVGVARGQDVSPPGQEPPHLLSNDPVTDFRHAREETLAAFGADGVLQKTGPVLGVAFSDQLLHGWDLAVATGQDADVPEDLAAAAYGFLHGRFTDEQRTGVFGPELPVGADATVQQQLLAYAGRDPAA